MTECKGTHPGTATFAVRADNSFLLVRRAKPGPGLGTWSVPGGRVERGETWQDASIREMAEETALTVPVVKLLAVTTTGPPDASDGELGWLTVWSMGRCMQSMTVTLNDEISEYAWVTCGDLWRYDLWKPHWTPLLDYYGGTTKLDVQLRGTWS